MKVILTPWFPPKVKPVRIGWYHTDFPFETGRTGKISEAACNFWWDGCNWLVSENGVGVVQDRYWRGRTER